MASLIKFAKTRISILLFVVGILFVAGWTGVRVTLGQQEVEFGPRLFVLSSTSDNVPSPLPPTIVVHAQLNINLGSTMATHFIASGGIDDEVALKAAGIPVRVIDADTTGKTYYFADATADNALTLASSVGQVIYQDQTVLLIALPKTAEPTLLETLLTHGVFISLLTPDPLHLQLADTLVQSQALTVPASTPDPTIASLLPLLKEIDLAARLAELSGATPVTLGGKTVSLKTRYSFSLSIQDAERYLLQYYTNLGIPVSYADWTVGSYSGHNVVAEMRGVVHPERIWLIGGHFDTISQNPLNAAPGADDNGTGTAATLLIAKILHNYQFADTIRFVHFSGEEQGQWGSKRYARDLSLRGAQIMGYINLDMIGWDGNGDRVVELHTGMGPKSNELGTALIASNNKYAQGLVMERKSATASRFSDHSPFWDNGYPAVLGIENFFDDAIARDRNPWYHNTGDLLEHVDLNYVARFGRVAMATLAELAGLQTSLPNTTPTPTATMTTTPTPTLSPTPLPTTCQNILVNGDFESAGGWQFGSTPYVAKIVNTLSDSGARALRLGVPPEAGNIYAHSSAFQKVTIPANAQQVILRYRQRAGGAVDGVDYRETLLLRSNYTYWSKVERSYAAGNDQWEEHTFDLTTYRGNTLVLYLNVYNNGKGSQMWNYIDNIALLACTQTQFAGTLAKPEPITPTPTLSETPDATATFVPTAVTATPTFVPTAPSNETAKVYLPLIQR